jgi:hypothetical protein
MGQTDKYIHPLYRNIAKKYTDGGSVVGMFGFTENDKLSDMYNKMDFYDLRLSNWDINGKWKEGKTYKTIVCLRTSGFAKNVNDLLESFHSRLKDDGILLIDWSLGSGHYPIDIADSTWGWDTGKERCYGKYNNQKCFLYSSCLTESCLNSTAFSCLCKSSSEFKRYKNVTNWEKQIHSEFENHELGSTKDILHKYDIVHETNWTPLNKNGRFQLYTIQVLRKK